MKGKLTFQKVKCSERNDAKDNSSIKTETITFVGKKNKLASTILITNLKYNTKPHSLIYTYSYILSNLGPKN